MQLTTLLFTTLLFSAHTFAQNVGIGTNNPSRARLEVHGAADATSAIFGGESSGISLQRAWPGIGFNQYYNAGNRYIGNGYAAAVVVDPGSGYMHFDFFPYGIANGTASSSTRALTLRPNGNVGISGAIPNGQLQLTNSLANRKLVLWESANNDHQFFGFGIQSGTLRYSVGGTGDVHRFYSGTNSVSSRLLMSIWGDRTVTISDETGGGRLGINLNSSPATLSLKQAGNRGLMIQEAASLTTWELRAAHYAPNNYSTLGVYHMDNLLGFFRPTGEYAWGSDVRLKADIHPLNTVLAKLLQLKPKTYTMVNANPGRLKSIGFIAQEVAPLFPELVSYMNYQGQNGVVINDALALNYTGFSILAVKAIQEQQAIIEKQSQKISDLEQRLTKLESLLKATH